MRYKDFKITEAALTSSSDDKYLPILNQMLKARQEIQIGREGDKTVRPEPGQQVQSRLDTFDAVYVNPNADPEDQEIVKIKANTVYKTQAMVDQARGQDPEKSGAKISNRGNVAEGVLGAATLARLTKRPGSDITKDDIGRIVKRVDPKTGVVQIPAKETENPNILDRFVLDVKLGKANFLDFLDWEKLTNDATMNGIIDNMVLFCNDARTVESYASFFEKNNRVDVVKVISDGISASTDRKTDIEMIYVDENGDRQTKHFDISLKAGTTNQFGQVGSGKGGLEVTEESWEIITNFFGSFGVDISSIQNMYMGRADRLDSYDDAYTKAYELFKDQLAGSDDDEEKLFLKKFISAIKYHATRDAPNVKLLQFEKSKYYVLDFKKIDRLLRADKLDLDVQLKYQNTQAGEIPKLVFFNKVNRKVFMEFRIKYEADKEYVRNLILKGIYMKELTKVRGSL